MEIEVYFEKQRNIVDQLNKKMEVVVKGSCALSNLIATHSKSFTEDKVIQEALIKTEDGMFPHKVKDVNKISLATDIVAEYVSDVSEKRDSLKSLVKTFKPTQQQQTKVQMPKILLGLHSLQ